MNLTRVISKSDTIGTTASTLCLLHCIATPFLFVAQASVGVHNEHPWWWGILDLAFLLISFFAVFWSARTTSKNWIRFALWTSWLLLGLLITNEKLHLWHLPEVLVYIPAISLIGLHIYNKKYCSCAGDSCCTNEEPLNIKKDGS